MAKEIHNHLALHDIEKKAQEFINTSLSYCEEELRLGSLAHPRVVTSRNTALVAVTLSVHESIKTFLAVAKIKRE